MVQTVDYIFCKTVNFLKGKPILAKLLSDGNQYRSQAASSHGPSTNALSGNSDVPLQFSLYVLNYIDKKWEEIKYDRNLSGIE